MFAATRPMWLLAAVVETSPAAMKDLSSLLSTDEYVWLFGDHHPPIPELVFETTLTCLQMVVDDYSLRPEPSGRIESLSHALRSAPSASAHISGSPSYLPLAPPSHVEISAL